MMDDKMKEEMMAELEKLGVSKDKVDDYMVWGVKKLMLGVMKIKWSLKENGIEGKEAEEILKKIVDRAVSMDAEKLHEMMHKHDDACCGHKGDWKDKK